MGSVRLRTEGLAKVAAERSAPELGLDAVLARGAARRRFVHRSAARPSQDRCLLPPGQQGADAWPPERVQGAWEDSSAEAAAL